MAQPWAQSFEQSSLLTSLPSLASQHLIKALVASGSRQLTELMTLCKGTRDMVLQHAPCIKFTEAGSSQDASTAHVALHAAATRKSGDLHLILHCGNSGALLSSAIQQPGGGGWSAVRKLEIQEAGTEPWGHLVGWAAPNITALALSCPQVPGSLFSSLAACSQLTSLQFSPQATLAPCAVRDAHILRQTAPHVRSLTLLLWQMLPVVEALGPQLTRMTMLSENRVVAVTAPPHPLPALSQCSQLTYLEIMAHMVDDAWLEVMLGLPSLRVVTLGMVGPLSTSFTSRQAPWALSAALVSPRALTKLPLKSLTSFSCKNILVDINDDQASHVSAAMRALGQLSQDQFVQRRLGVMIRLSPAGRLDAPASLLQQSAHAVLAAFGRCDCAPWVATLRLNFMAGVLEQFGAAEVRAVSAGALGKRVLGLSLRPNAPLGADFWGSLLTCFPELTFLGLDFAKVSTTQLSTINLAVFMATCPRAVEVCLHRAPPQTRAAAEEAMAVLNDQGQESKVSLKFMN